jgi:hypothetical protein
MQLSIEEMGGKIEVVTSVALVQPVASVDC